MKTNEMYQAMTLAYQTGNDAEVLRLGAELEGKRLAKSKSSDVTHMLRTTRSGIELDRLRGTFTGKELAGTIRWFDASSGEGMAEVAGHSVHVHFSAIDGVDKNNLCWATEGDRARLESVLGGYNVPATFKVYVAGAGELMAERVTVAALA